MTPTTCKRHTVEFFATLTLVIATAFVHKTALSAEEPRSTVSILVDLSETWHNEQSKLANQKILQTVAEGVTELGRLLRPPVHIRMLPIGDASLLRPPLCEALYDPKLISSAPKDTRVFTQEKPLLKYLKVDCVLFILSRPKEKFTDISGAIDSASRFASIQAGADRILIILSDMLEELPINVTAANISLPTFRSLILYRTLNDDRKNPSLLDKRLNEWKAKIGSAGSEITMIPDEGVVSGQIVRLLRR
ncbi:MAG: hypothetical protein FJX39_08465 [Alphaproteobacteria bacterium]|nr:hypothetical protein [Alphaproteobacteria bacterium]